MHQRVPQEGRNRQFDLLRLVFATLVLLAHAPEITDGNRSRELLSRLTHTDLTFGVLGVDGFFLLSGFLIVQSWDRDPVLLDFLRKRVLRIVPGYVVAALLSTLLIGLLAPGIPAFFHHLLNFHFIASILLLSSPVTPVVFPGTRYTLVNGALWTITFEFRCYLLVALLGLCGLIRRRWLWLGVSIFLLSALLSAGVERHLEWHRLKLLTGEPAELYRLTAIFFVGGCFYLFRDRILFRPAMAIAAAALLVLGFVFFPLHAEFFAVLCGAYVLFFIAHSPIAALTSIRRYPDISYGVYLYGWPVESLWAWYVHGSPWVNFVVSTAVCYLLGWLSWHYVERPMLKFKRGATAPLPSPGDFRIEAV